VPCRVVPPGVTNTFFSGMPPNATISSVFSTIVGQEDAARRTAFPWAHQVRQQHLRRADAVAVPRGRVAAEQAEEPVQLALRVVEPPGAGPAVRPAEDRLVAVGRAAPGPVRPRARSSAWSQPTSTNGSAAAPVGRPRPVLQPPAPHGGPGHAGGVTQASGNVAEQRRRAPGRRDAR